MTKPITVNVAMSCDEAKESWRCLIENTIALHVRCYNTNDICVLSRDDLEAALWIIEVWSAGLVDPVGFRTAYQLAGKARCLLVFNRKPGRDFPDEGTFWITYAFTGSLADKINTLLLEPRTKKATYNSLLGKYPQLAYRHVSKHH